NLADTRRLVCRLSQARHHETTSAADQGADGDLLSVAAERGRHESATSGADAGADAHGGARGKADGRRRDGTDNQLAHLSFPFLYPLFVSRGRPNRAPSSLTDDLQRCDRNSGSVRLAGAAGRPPQAVATNDSTNSTRKTMMKSAKKKRAMVAAPAAMPVKP